MSKTEIWDALKTTDPAHTKGFSRSGGFKGTAIKPQWVVQRLTEEFGPCGVGWGMGEPSFQVVPAGSEVLVFCKVQAWHGDRANILYGVGGDKVMVQRRDGPFVDDEAFKKAYTDALMNAFKFIGVAADVHLGLFDDNKYVAEAKESFNPPPEGPRVPKGLNVSPEGEDWWTAEGNPSPSASQAKKDGLGEVYDRMRQEIQDLHTEQAWRDWCSANSPEIGTMPKDWRIQLRLDAEVQAKEIGFNIQRK